MKSRNQLIIIFAAVSLIVAVGITLWTKTDVFDTQASEFPKSISDLSTDWKINPIQTGSKDAKVELIEFSSLSCPHCATFHANVLPKLISEYVDSGKLSIVYFDFPLDNVAYGASIFSRCVESNLRPKVISMLYTSQASWLQGSSPLANLLYSSKLIGMTEEKFNKCAEDESISETIYEERKLGEEIFAVNSTPSIFINGKKVINPTYNAVKTAIEEALSE